MIPERPDSQPGKENAAKIKAASGDRILFWCSHCGQKYHLPRYLAGKSGVCIKCNDYLLIPTESQLEPKPARNVVFPCKYCGEKLKKSRKQIGLKVKCSKCGQKVVVPEKSQISALAKTGTEPEERILFWCTYCGQKYRLPKHLVGKSGNCDKCKHDFIIPKVSEKKPKLIKTVKFSCDHCGAMLWEKQELAGKQINCNRCGGSVAVLDKLKEPSLIGKAAVAEERILFWCEICGQKYRLRKSHVGKSGICDNCHNNFIIPPESQIKPKLKKTVKFSCKHCGTKLVKPRDIAGSEVKCYKCGENVTVPRKALKSLIQRVTPPLLVKPAIIIEATRTNLKMSRKASLPKISLKVPEKIKLKKRTANVEERVLFWCTYCGQKYRLRKSYGGRSGICDKCHNKFFIPYQSEIEPKLKETIIFSCEHCGAILRKEKKLIGAETECFECGRKVIVKKRRSVPKNNDGRPIKLINDEIVAETTRTSLVVVGRIPTQYLSKLKHNIGNKAVSGFSYKDDDEKLNSTLTEPRIIITEDLPTIYRVKNFFQQKGEKYLFFALIAIFLDYLIDTYGGGYRPSKTFTLFTSFTVAASILLGTWNYVTAVPPSKTSMCRYHIMCTDVKCGQTEIRRFKDLDIQKCKKCRKPVGLVYYCMNCHKFFPYNEYKERRKLELKNRQKAKKKARKTGEKLKVKQTLFNNMLVRECPFCYSQNVVYVTVKAAEKELARKAKLKQLAKDRKAVDKILRKGRKRKKRPPRKRKKSSTRK